MASHGLPPASGTALSVRAPRLTASVELPTRRRPPHLVPTVAAAASGPRPLAPLGSLRSVSGVTSVTHGVSTGSEFQVSNFSGTEKTSTLFSLQLQATTAADRGLAHWQPVPLWHSHSHGDSDCRRGRTLTPSGRRAATNIDPSHERDGGSKPRRVANSGTQSRRTVTEMGPPKRLAPKC